MASGRTIINAFIGAVVGIVLSFIPFSTVVGGAVAGFLEGPDDRDGLLVGALAGLITFVPIAAVGVLAIGFVGFGMGVAAVPAEGFAFVAFVILAGISFALLYTVGLSLLGGYLGAYLAREYPARHARTRETIGMGRSTPRRTDRVDGPSEPTSHDVSEAERPTTESTAEPAGDRRSDRDDTPEEERSDSLRWHEDDDRERDA